MAVISVHGEVRHNQPQVVMAAGNARALFAVDRDESFLVKAESSSRNLATFKGSDSIEGSLFSVKKKKRKKKKEKIFFFFGV